MIGFEFETSTQIKWSDGDGLRDKQDALFGTLRGRFRPQPGQDPGPAWKVSCDTGHLEIVTEPFDNEAANADAEKERMAGVFADIRIFTDLLAAEGEVTLTADSLEGVATVSDPAKDGVTFSVTGSSMWAAPQATIGFTLDKIWNAASSLVNTNLRIFEAAERSVRQETPGGISLSGMNPIQGKCLVDAATQARAQIKSLHDRVLQNQPDDPWPAAYEGFLTIVISYLLMGDRQDHEWKYYKQIAPLMSRISLGELLADETIPKKWAQTFTPEWVLKAAGLGDGVLYKKGVLNSGNIRRSDWLTSIQNGGDSLAALEKNETGSMSSLDGDVRVTADRKRLYPLELRRLPKEIKPQDWDLLAGDLYDIARQWSIAAT